MDAVVGICISVVVVVNIAAIDAGMLVVAGFVVEIEKDTTTQPMGGRNFTLCDGVPQTT